MEMDLDQSLTEVKSKLFKSWSDECNNYQSPESTNSTTQFKVMQEQQQLEQQKPQQKEEIEQQQSIMFSSNFLNRNIPKENTIMIIDIQFGYFNSKYIPLEVAYSINKYNIPFNITHSLIAHKTEFHELSVEEKIKNSQLKKVTGLLWNNTRSYDYILNLAMFENVVKCTDVDWYIIRGTQKFEYLRSLGIPEEKIILFIKPFNKLKNEYFCANHFNHSVLYKKQVIDEISYLKKTIAVVTENESMKKRLKDLQYTLKENRCAKNNCIYIWDHIFGYV